MKQKKQPSKTSTLGFFKYFQKLIGYHLYLYIIVNMLVGLLDGLGLVLFIPLLAIATGTDTGDESLGKLQFLTDFIVDMGIPLNLTSVLLLMIIVFSVKAIMGYLRQLYFIKIRLFIIKKLRINLINGLRRLSYNGYTSYDIGKIQNTMVAETGRLVQAMTNYFTTIQNSVMLLTYVILAFIANWQFAILIAIGGLFTNIVYKWINKYTKQEAAKWSMVGRRFNKHLIETIHYFKYLKATNYFTTYEKNLRKDIHDQETIQFKIGNLNAIATNIREPLIIIVIAAVIVVQIKVLGSEFAALLASLLLFYRALGYMTNMQNTWNSYLANAYGLEAVNELLEEFKEQSESIQSKEKVENIGNIKLENISVYYGDKKVIKDVNLSIERKSTIALVGESGAGKSTLANVISGLVAPNTGNIYINKNQLEQNKINSYRDRVGYIAQEPVIFDDTLFNNITFWKPKTEENIKRFNECVHLVHLEGFVKQLPNGIDSTLGHSGVLVSGGQKQRISIARELFKGAELLIMDEATSALDSETENIIKQNIESLHGQYTMVIIAHRLSTIKHADVIYEMKDGEVVNQGNFKSLYEKSNSFQKMVDLQEV